MVEKEHVREYLDSISKLKTSIKGGIQEGKQQAEILVPKFYVPTFD